MTSATQLIRRRRARKARKAAAHARTRTWTNFLIFLVTLVLAVPLAVIFGGAAIVYVQAVRDLPTPAQTTFISAAVGPTQLFDRTNRVMLYAVEDPLGDERTWIRLDDLPPYVVQSTLLVEDPDFLTVTRFDLIGTTIRLWRNILFGPIEADPSLTGRLVRNAMLPQAQADGAETVSASRRNREIALVAEVNRRYRPEAVLEWHLNTNFYGNEAYGIEAAAQVYLGKSARDLTLGEAALLASIPTAPQFNPIDDETAARGRQADTLRRMAADGLITDVEYADAVRQFVPIQRSAGRPPAVAPDFALYARRQAEQILDGLGMNGGRLVTRSGLRITTTLDIDLYLQAECALRAHLERLAGGAGQVTTLTESACSVADMLPTSTPANTAPPDEGAVIVLDVATGEVRALLGSAVRAIYQPGPTLYPFVYFQGFREQQQNKFYTPAAMVLDIPQTYPGAVEGLFYQPTNLDNRYSGPLTVREAASIGLLPPAVEVANNHGLSNVLRSARNLGLNSPADGLYDLSLLDHGGAVSLLDVGYAYSVLSSMGNMYGVPAAPRGVGYRNRDPVAVLRIEDANGVVLWEYNAPTSRVNVFNDNPELGYLVNQVFADAEVRRRKFGDDNPLNPSRPAAVVNGLTSDRIENWTVGYTPQYVVGVHLSRSDSAPVGLSGYGLNGAASLWNALLEFTHQGLPPTDWPRPERVVERVVCELSGLLPHDACRTRRDVFIEALQPNRVDTYWQSVEVNGSNGLRATASTPDSLRRVDNYFVPPDAARDWWVSNGQPLPPPTNALDFTRAGDQQFVGSRLTAPTTFSFMRGIVEIRGEIEGNDVESYQLSYGAELNPQRWFAIGEASQTVPPDGVLGRWDTSALNGLYTVELAVIRTGGRREASTVSLYLDNAPPTLLLAAGEPGKIYRWPEEQTIPLRIEIDDNYNVQRVEFYRNSELIFTDSEAPYQYDYFITRIGLENFYAVAYDVAGNRSQSLDVPVEITR